MKKQHIHVGMRAPITNKQVCAFSQTRFSLVCSVVLTDRAEVALAATEWRLGWSLPAWTVPTPPVASYSSSDEWSDSTDEL